MNRQESLMNLVDSLHNLYAGLNEPVREEYQDQINDVCHLILDGSISADLADKMAELLKVYSTNLEKGMVSDVKSEQKGGAFNDKKGET